MNNLLFCSVGRRGRLLRNAKKSLGDDCIIVGTDNKSTAPALYFADREYVVPRVDASNYIETILKIAKENEVKAITTVIDPEIEILANNRELFLRNGILPLCPSKESAHYCFNIFEMFQHLQRMGIRTIKTYHSLEDFDIALKTKDISFPVFMKPISGSGSVGAHIVFDMEQLLSDWNSDTFDYIIQELMTGGDCDADVYVDCISHKAVSVFSKKKIETRIGGANKTISFKDEKLFQFIREICDVFEFNGPLDMDFFIKDGDYYLSEINPRFGGAYLHAFGAGVDFFKMIANNIAGIINDDTIGQYDENILMMMYDDVVIRKKSDLVDDNFDIL